MANCFKSISLPVLSEGFNIREIVILIFEPNVSPEYAINVAKTLNLNYSTHEHASYFEAEYPSVQQANPVVFIHACLFVDPYDINYKLCLGRYDNPHRRVHPDVSSGDYNRCYDRFAFVR